MRLGPSNGHRWIDRPGTILRAPHGPRGGGLYAATCSCGWSKKVSTRAAAKAAYQEHRLTAPWRCPECGETEPRRRAVSPDTAKCKSCLTKRVRAWAAANRERYERRQWAYDLRVKYGITPEVYEALLEAQGGRCPICGTADPPTRYGRKIRWHVDHDHATGLVRGILCFRCNQGLGCLGDDIARLQAAILYLAG